MAKRASRGTPFVDSATTLDLILRYEKAQHQISHTLELEEARRLRVTLLSLQHQNADLRHLQSQDDCRIKGLEDWIGRIVKRARTAEKDQHALQDELQTRQQTIETIQAELADARKASAEASRDLAEKRILAQDAHLLSLELDRLRSQADSHHALFAEKLSLQQQLDASRVELELEKRATKRALAKSEDQRAQDIRVKSRLAELQLELAKERHGTRKAEREIPNAFSEQEDQRMLSGRRHNVLGTNSAVSRNQQRAAREVRPSDEPRTDYVSLDNSATKEGKRTVKQPLKDENGGTPSALPNAGRLNRASIPFGEKSTFSITPYLNRTSGFVAQSASPSSQHQSDDPREKSGLKPTPSPSSAINNEASLTCAIDGLHKSGELSLSLSVIEQTGSASYRGNSDQSASRGANEEMVASEKGALGSFEGVSAAPSLNRHSRSAVVAKRKRKVLGSQSCATSFEGDEGAAKNILVPDSALAEKLRDQVRLNTGHADVQAARKVPAVDAFSPLKKNRRIIAR